MIRVDMIRKLVIIAIGGKIGNPFPSLFRQLPEREQLDQNHPMDSDAVRPRIQAVVPRAVWTRGRIMDDLGPLTS